MNTYIVGGAVRDHFLDVKSNDTDYVVVGATVTDMLVRGYEQIGKDFPVFLHPKTQDEYALARRERSTGPSHNDFEVETSNVTLEEDLSRRDLTMNAMAMTLNGTIIDPFNGQADIENKVLRHTSEAFKEDPVRVLRVARFRARFGPDWTVAPETKVLIRTMWSSLLRLQAERVWKEVSRALMEPYPRLFFDTLFECNVLEDTFPDIHILTQTREGSKHHREASVYEHTMMMLELLAHSSKPYGLTLRLAALYHDIGKPYTYRNKGNSNGHEKLELVENLVPKWIPASTRRKVLMLITNHTKVYKAHEMRANSIATFLEQYRHDRELLVMQVNLAQADDKGRITDYGIHKTILQEELLKAFDVIEAYSPKEWINSQITIWNKTPSGETIKQHVHQTNISIVKMYFT